MLNKISKKIKILIVLSVLIAATWFLVVQPQLSFRSNEKSMEEAAKRYYELNSFELPTGERIKTLPLQKLYDAGVLEQDFFRPLSKKTCSNTNSWVKVRKENGEFKYYVYLDCGRLKSRIDHEGPKIILNGDSVVTISKDSKYKDLGVRSVIDNEDGELKITDVTTKGKVDTSQIGTYNIEYIAFDKMSNRSSVTREVRVVRRLYKEVSNNLKGEQNFKGNPSNNYLRLSNIMFRIYGLDKDKNVIAVSDMDIANVSYNKLDKWLDYFYKNLNKNAQKMLVSSKFCSMTKNENQLTNTECDSYTDTKKVFVPSSVEVNNAQQENLNFMKPYTLSWIADKKNDKEAYVTRGIAFLASDRGVSFFPYDATENYGVRPMVKIKGSQLIVSGDGTRENPYSLGDTKKLIKSEPLNQREVGEYVSDGATLWRIVKIMEDGTTKVISTSVESGYQDSLRCYPTNTSGVFLYNPSDKNSVGYCINNKATQFFNITNFVKHEIEVPIYQNKITYGEEKEVKKYKAVLSAPNMFEMFSAYSGERGSYWLINSSKKEYVTGVISEIGVPINYENTDLLRLSVRPVAYFKDSIVVTSGKGTESKPYLIK